MVRRLEAESACLENILKEMNGTAERRLQESAVRLDAADDRLKRNASSAIAENSLKLSGFKRALDNLSPVRLARRGYSLVRIDGQPLLKAAQAFAGAVLTVQMLDGDVNGIVQHMSKRS
jgi:exonuclease VII large subunit